MTPEIKILHQGHVWINNDLAVRFNALSEILRQSQLFWRHHAFRYMHLPWESELPALSLQLRQLPLDQVERFARDDNALIDFLSPHLPLLKELKETCAIGHFDIEPLPTKPEPCDIPGRKWQQIRYFAACVPANAFGIVEWCAGKSHLGRTLAQRRSGAVSAIERDGDLIAAGMYLAAREKINIDFHRADVMSDAVGALLLPQQNAIALHACGDLHARLLRLCTQKQTATLTVAPCCYHLMQDETHYCLSQAASAKNLRLVREDLRTAVHGTVTASAKQNRQRQQLQAWRLGFDLLQRELRGCDTYLPAMSLSTMILKKNFRLFCETLAAAKQIELSPALDYDRYEAAGRQRLREVAALDLPRIAFRRALELWLALDRGLFLREHGYRVELGQFCAPALTPRNLLIRAYAAS